MTMTTKNEIFSRYLPEYISLDTSKERQGEILTAVCEVVGLHRKAAIRKFRKLQLTGVCVVNKRGPKKYYDPATIAALRTVWEAASEICGELLHPVISEYVSALQRDKLWQHNAISTDKLSAMSEATVKRRVGAFMKARVTRKGLSSTKPSNLKNIIPIFTGPWEDKVPGNGQIDTVVHCGSSLLGDMAYTLNYTDVPTLWISLRAQWNKGQEATRNSLIKIREKLPFPMLGAHPDTGSEFINYFVWDWCKQNNIELTRSRPSHKNDNAYVEQKNGHVVRRFMGYTRLDCPEVIDLINEMYNKLEIYLNHFVPSRKCVEKIRIGARYKRKYSKAMTAYRRVLAHKDVGQKTKDKLITQHEQLNPLLLKQEIDKLIDRIFKLQKCYRDAKNELAAKTTSR